jgi:hypothetical protein
LRATLVADFLLADSNVCFLPLSHQQGSFHPGFAASAWEGQGGRVEYPDSIESKREEQMVKPNSGMVYSRMIRAVNILKVAKREVLPLI